MRRATTVFDISRLTSGKLQLEPETFDLVGLLRDVADEYADAARRAGIPIRVAVPKSLRGTWDARSLCASPDPGRGWGECV